MRRWSNWTLRGRMVIVVLSIAGSGLLVTDVVAVNALHTYLVRQVDDELLSAVSGPVRRLDRLAEPSEQIPGMRPLLIPTSKSVTILTLDGQVLIQYGGDLRLSDKLPDLEGFDAQAVTNEQGKAFTIKGESGSFRAVARIAGNQTVILVVAKSLQQVEETVLRLSLLLLVIGLIALLILGLMARGVVNLGLRPLRAVEKTADEIAMGDFSARIGEFDPRTEVGRVTAALNTMLTRVEEAFQARAESEAQLRRFVADASHELRTPLTAIRGFSELAQQGAVSPEDANARIEKESLRMTTLVEDLLLLARLDQQRPLELNSVDVRTLLDETVEEAQSLHKSHIFELNLPQAEVIVDADNQRLHQAVINLLRNAGIHTPAGTTVVTSLKQEGSRIKISVTDNGPGISKEHLDKIFERFYRADDSRARKEIVVGSGLGLSIVKSIAEAHRGTVSAHSSDAGTEFVITLPLRHQ